MTDGTIKLNAYGRRIDIEFINGEWIASYPGNDGKRLRATNLAIPASLDREQVVTYIADLLHESATGKHASVEILD
jgi:hypothetical protein